ncbi:MAG: ATP-dependent RNA helicase HrpA [Deltaproteobacteria bacterium]|nr:ATP-dependent RNA helicase HrpA [Deltaproteobacteria bacterium]
MKEIKEQIGKLESSLGQVLKKDRFIISKKIKSLKNNINRDDFSTDNRTDNNGKEKVQKSIDKIKESVSVSIEKKRKRIERKPGTSYDESLPINTRREEIIETIKNNQVVIISGETGSGKTTQIPKFCIDAGRGIDGKIGCTQPRRIAAVNVGKRIAEELNAEVGKSVGYKIRFQDKSSANTYIKLMTDGILLAEAQGDRFLNEYDTIIVDEAHERSLNIDFVLGILNNLIKRRKDLKLIVTSATIDTEKFSKAFGNAPIIEVSGRTFPVELRYDPIIVEEKTHVEKAVEVIEKVIVENPVGDILVFMPTEQDIRVTIELLEGRKYSGLSLLPLYARLASSDQSKIFSGTGLRKIIVSTNVAETSLTIPGIKYVIDTGLARIASYSPRSRTTSLPVVPISKSSADQRKGRCGRVENGICLRLFEEEDFETRQLFTAPEILRANLAEVILRMVALKLGDVEAFPFIDKPSKGSIQDGFNLLLELSAIKVVTKKRGKKSEKQTVLTEKGAVMARLPVDPGLSSMLLCGFDEGKIEEVAVIVSALTIQDPRERPSGKEKEADAKQALYKDESSDFLSLLKLWKDYQEKRKKFKTWGQLKRYCLDKFVSFRRMREWVDIHNQLISTLKENGFDCKNKVIKKEKEKQGQFDQTYSAIHRSILSGFLSNIAHIKESNMYNAAKGREVMVFPGSGLFNNAGKWIVSAEMVETSRLFARINANIDVSWLEKAGGDLCKYSYFEPHWEKKRGETVVSEQVTLFGLVIIPKRKVSYGKINPTDATQIFIRSALVDGDIDYNLLGKEFSFMEHNLSLVNDVEALEDKVRKKDILISEDELCTFYHEKLQNIYSVAALKKLIKKRRGSEFLQMDKEYLLKYTPEEEELNLYPDTVKLGNNVLSVDYNFNPGKDKDGVTLKVPSEKAHQIPVDSLDWLVPGLFKEKITTLIKGLPKEHRVKLVPVSTTVDIILKEMEKVDGPLATSLSLFIFKRLNISIPATAWDDSELPEYLKMRISVTNKKGEEIESGRDKSLLKQDYGAAPSLDLFEKEKKKWEKKGLTTWDFGDLKETIVLENSGEVWACYPALQEEEDSVALTLYMERDKALLTHKNGVLKLYSLKYKSDLKHLKKSLKIAGNVEKLTNYFGGKSTFEKRLYGSYIRKIYEKNIRTSDEFIKHGEDISKNLLKESAKFLKRVESILSEYHETRTIIYNFEISSRGNQTLLSYFEKIREELAKLIPENFMEIYKPDDLNHLVRFIKAHGIRAKRGFDDLEKDRQKEAEVNIFSVKLIEELKGLSEDVSQEKRDAVEEFFWMIEEYKVSLYAQEIKTARKISKKRLEKFYENLCLMV